MKTTHLSGKRILWLAPACLFLALGVAIMAGWAGEADTPSAPAVLARVEVPGTLKDLNLPVYAGLKDAAGRTYALVIATPTQLKTAGVPFQTLDTAPPGARYLLARERRAGARLEAASANNVLYDDGHRILVREAPDLAARLAKMGFAPKRLPAAPLSLIQPARIPQLPAAFTPNPLVAAMMARVNPDAVESFISGLSGETPVVVEGSEYTIATRYTGSGTPIEKATQYIFERLKALDLDPDFQPWSSEGYSGRNVIGELRGVDQPGEVVLLVAHLDSLPDTGGVAPGADDNASGCATLLLAADVMSRYYRFDRTIKFLFTTGEEQDLYGATAYAASVAGQDITAVINVDNIAYTASPTQKSSQIHIRTAADPGNPADRQIADTFVNVVNSYGLSGILQPVVNPDGETAGDHYAFWTAKPESFAAVLVIEDDVNHYNPNNHQATDKLEFLNMTYCTAQVKAALGTAAHLAGILGAGQDPWLMLLLDDEEE